MIRTMKDAELDNASRSLHLIALLTVAGAWAFGFMRNFDPTTQTTRLPVLGVTFQVGDAKKKGTGMNLCTNKQKEG